MEIIALDEHPAVVLAADELARCLGQMTGRHIQVKAPGHWNEGEEGIYVGAGEALGQLAGLPQVDNPKWDDGFSIRSIGESLVIAGVNPRSALMGAYQYLRELGAEWLWPGEDGEVLPRINDIPLSGFDINQAAANRHRGVCIEGATALEHVLDMVKWMPKVGLNAYFLQFQVSSHFWRRWYEHQLNPTWQERRELTEEECREMDDTVIAAVKERGLLLHRVGHGWTAAAIGLPTNGWVPYEGELSDEQIRLIAEVNGKREVWGNIPINTELCYSNPEARRRLVEKVLEFAREHPEVDFLHFWLSDGTNNQCECPECRRLSPSDWYVMLLNEISPRLRKIAPDMKLVFLAYTNTLWPPEQVELDLSHDNLVYMFAPISRCYAHRLSDPRCGEDRPLARPERNRLVMPHDNRDNWQLLRLWDAVRPRDSFAFDYHFMWIWREDNMTVRLADLMPEDIEDYARQGIGGLVNCCNQRIFYPNGWPFYVMARALWGMTPAVDEKAKYFSYAYGDAASTASAFFDDLVELTGAPLHGRSWWEAADRNCAETAIRRLTDQRPMLEEAARTAASLTQEHSWQLLLHYHELLSLLWAALQAKQAGDINKAGNQLEAAVQFVQRTEADTARALDTFEMVDYLEKLRQIWQE